VINSLVNDTMNSAITFAVILVGCRFQFRFESARARA